MFKGEYYKGLVKKSSEQVKKHITQMKQEEIRFLVARLKSLNPKRLIVSKHLMNKTNVVFKSEDVRDIIKDKRLKYLIIEYNEIKIGNEIDKRVLIRGRRNVNVLYIRSDGTFFEGLSNLCAVISLNKNCIITCYWNLSNDAHKSIDLNRYNKDLPIIN